MDVTANVISLGQERTTTAKTLVSHINVKLKKDVTASSSIVLNMYVTLAASKTTVIATSKTVMASSDIDTAYAIETFKFDGLELTT